MSAMDFCYCDIEPASVYRATTHVARKPHKCVECHAQVKPGERYERVFAIWDCEVQIIITCPRCLALREFVRAHVPCWCFNHYNMRDEALDVARAIAHEAPGVLFGAYRRELLIRRTHRAQAQARGT